MKKWWTSRTEIGAIVFSLAVIVQTILGDQWFEPKLQTAVVILYFAIIRLLTNEGIEL